MNGSTDQDDNLIQYVNRSLEDDEEFHFLRFEFLHRLNIVDLEVKLVRLKSLIRRNRTAQPSQLDELNRTLRSYGKLRAADLKAIIADPTIRDYEYLRQHKSLDKEQTRDRKLRLQLFFQSAEDFGDPFQSHYSWFQNTHDKIDPVRRAFMRHLPSRLTYSHHERQERKKEYMEGKPPKKVSIFVDRLVRLITALVGGLFLIVPVHIMSFSPSLIKSLVTVSVAVVVFAFVVSFLVRVTNIETLVSTATYAAVLVVFVGSTAGGSGDSTANM
ncbi:hypothetical protein CONLIGDRAFT_646490 [Coniochaeta ligniaria NRRL 30616]|uniref:DUF6594 domain-containing protein n=1 Tax=Coniochaeta ligniaria NRRL 30616 TaxID=1408157 RepID=A0A1J7IYZ7_9PEZI|nr:hypothetical protein CONLIGDRAFT_646490 [Coniochaeta ligniaria NRRL 30616]